MWQSLNSMFLPGVVHYTGVLFICCFVCLFICLFVVCVCVGHENNIHCLAIAVNALAGAIFSFYGKEHQKDRMKEFLVVSLRQGLYFKICPIILPLSSPPSPLPSLSLSPPLPPAVHIISYHDAGQGDGERERHTKGSGGHLPTAGPGVILHNHVLPIYHVLPTLLFYPDVTLSVLLYMQFVEESPFLSRDMLESCFPYGLLRDAYNSVYRKPQVSKSPLPY